MTAPLLDDLTVFEFSIPCEWEDSPCGQAANVMVKGCDDEHGRAMCLEHYAALRQWFNDNKPAVCSVCHRPFMFFETHYHVLEM